MIYFDNAATTGHKPIGVINAVDYTLKNLCANPGRSGHDLSQKAALKVYESRKIISEYFGADGAENVAFTQNCTASINFVLKGLLDSGDNVIISDLEHNAVMRPLNIMKNISYSTANVSFFNDTETIKNFEALIKENTKMIFCTAASNVTGKILPLEKIGQICKRRGLFFGVDAAQAAGVVPIDMKKMNIDFLCIAPHKGLYAPMGIGVLIARKPLKRTVIEGGTGTNSVDFSQPKIMPEMLESGTLNLPSVLGTAAGINFIKSKCRIYEYEMGLVRYFYKGLLKNSKAELYTNPTDCGYVPVLPFNISGIPSEETAEFLNKGGFALRAGLHCAPTAHRKIGTLKSGAVRFSPSVFNNQTEVNMLLNRLKKFLK